MEGDDSDSEEKKKIKKKCALGNPPKNSRQKGEKGKACTEID